MLALSFLWSLGSLRADLLPYAWQGAAASSLAGQALRLAVPAFEAAILARLLRSPRVSRRGTMHAALIGLGLFAVPALLIHLAAPYVADLTRTALFSFTPVFAVVFEPYLGRPNASQSRSALLAALVSVSGALFLFPVNLPGSPQSFCALCAVLLATLCVAAVNCRAVRVACAPDAPAPIATAAIAAAAAAVALSLVSTSAEPALITTATLVPELVWTTLVDLPALLLLFWLMRRITAARMTLRFILAPVLTGIFGLILFQPPVGLRAVAGLALMALGAAWMLLARDTETDDSSLHLESNPSNKID